MSIPSLCFELWQQRKDELALHAQEVVSGVKVLDYLLGMLEMSLFRCASVGLGKCSSGSLEETHCLQGMCITHSLLHCIYICAVFLQITMNESLRTEDQKFMGKVEKHVKLRKLSLKFVYSAFVTPQACVSLIGG